jgi:hypothetical protein
MVRKRAPGPPRRFAFIERLKGPEWPPARPTSSAPVSSARSCTTLRERRLDASRRARPPARPTIPRHGSGAARVLVTGGYDGAPRPGSPPRAHSPGRHLVPGEPLPARLRKNHAAVGRWRMARCLIAHTGSGAGRRSCRAWNSAIPWPAPGPRSPRWNPGARRRRHGPAREAEGAGSGRRPRDGLDATGHPWRGVEMYSAPAVIGDLCVGRSAETPLRRRRLLRHRVRAAY